MNKLYHGRPLRLKSYTICLIIFSVTYFASAITKMPKLASIALLLSMIYVLLYILKHVKDFKTAIQYFTLFLILLIFWSFSLAAVIANNISFHRTALLIELLLVICTIMQAKYIYTDKKKISEKIGANINSFIYTGLICLTFYLLYLNCYSYLFKSDSNTYYSTIEAYAGTWNFDLINLSKLEIGYHNAFGYTLFVYPWHLLLHVNGIGIRTCNLIMYEITIIFLYFTIKKISIRLPNVIICLLVASFALNPFTLGLAQEISTDMPLMCFFVWLIFADTYDLKILFLFNSFLLAFSKEVGILVLFGYVTGKLLAQTAQDKRLLIKKFIINKELLTIFPAVLFIICYKFSGNTWGSESPLLSRRIGIVNTIQFNPEYIVIKLEQIFILNFQWIIWGVLLTLLVHIIIKRTAIKINPIINGTVISLIMFILFNLIYFTYPHARYLELNIPIEILLIGYLLNFCECNTNKKNGNITQIATLIVVLLTQLTQTYLEIDPISNTIFPRTYTGKTYIISLAYYAPASDDQPNYLLSRYNGGDMENEQYRDYVQINRQYEDFETLFETALKMLNYNEHDAIYLCPIYDDPYWGKFGYTMINMFGTYYPYSMHWNQEYNQITYNDEDVPINWVENLKDIDKQYKHIYCFFLPFNTQYMLNDFNIEYSKRYLLQNKTFEFFVCDIDTLTSWKNIGS